MRRRKSGGLRCAAFPAPSSCARARKGPDGPGDSGGPWLRQTRNERKAGREHAPGGCNRRHKNGGASTFSRALLSFRKYSVIRAGRSRRGASRVAAGAVVLEEVPPNSTVVGVPARVVRQNGKKIERKPLDQIHISDPVQQQIDMLEKRIKQLEKAKGENK